MCHLASRRSRARKILLLGLGLMLSAASPADAQKQGEQYIERFQGKAFTMTQQTAQTSTIQIGIKRWTTSEERDALLQTLVKEGREAFVKALQQQDDLGFVRFETGRSTLRYAWSEVAEDGSRKVVVATDRPLGHTEVMQRDRTLRYDVTMAVLDLNAKGRGTGNLALGVEVGFDPDQKAIILEHYEAQPLRLTGIRSQIPKSKK